MTNGWKATVRLHLKILSQPTSVTPATMVARMTEIYRTVGIDVVVASTPENLNLAALDDLTVGGCAMGSTTLEQDELFSHRTGAAADEICIYFVRTTFFPYRGCGAFPPNTPGAVIASCASEWTLAHECGHVLGLSHVPTPPNRLMVSEGPSNVANPPPTLTDPEAKTIIASPYSH
jgi:hypothetical protein